mgnify:CR=1 FL=1
MKSIFEVIVDRLSSNQGVGVQTLNPPNHELTLFGYDAYNLNQSQTPQSIFSDIVGLDNLWNMVAANITQLTNNNFEDGWLYSTPAYYTGETYGESYAQFYIIQGWDTILHSIDNHGMNQGKSAIIESTTTAGYTNMLGGNSTRLRPTLFLNSNLTTGSTPVRIGNVDNFVQVPIALSSPTAGSSTNAYSTIVGGAGAQRCIDYGSYQALNIPSSLQDAIVYREGSVGGSDVNCGIRIQSNSVTSGVVRYEFGFMSGYASAELMNWDFFPNFEI